MASTVRIHLDEHCSHKLAKGLRRRGFDVITTSEAGLISAADERRLQYAEDNRRVIVTCDADYPRLHKSGWPHHGIISCLDA